MQFNWFDWVVVLLIFLYTWQGWDHELHLVGSEFLSWVCAWLGSLWLAETLAKLLVGAFGLWPQSSWLWSMIVLVVIIQQVVYRALQLLMIRVPKIFLPKLMQFGLGLWGSMGTGLMVITFLVLVAVKLPFDYPLNEDIRGGFWGRQVTIGVEAAHRLLWGTELNMGLQ